MEESMIDDDLIKPLNPYKGINKYPFGSQLLIWGGIFMGCFFVAQLISGGIIILYYKSVDIHQIASHTGDLNVLRLAQMVATIFGFLLPALIFSQLKDHSITRYSNANVGFHPLLLIIIPLMVLTIYPIINVSFFVNQWMPWNDWMKETQGEYKVIVDALLTDKTVLVFILNFLTVAALPAICEEWIFRGTLQKILGERINIHAAIFISAVIFSFIHMEFSGFLPRILLGMFLGYLYYYSGSLWANIFAHLVNNSAQIVIMYLGTAGIYKGDVDKPVMPEIWELVVYTIAFAALCRLFYHFSPKRKMSNFA